MFIAALFTIAKLWKQPWNLTILMWMDGTGEHHSEQD
jgi:hypothetical protein